MTCKNKKTCKNSICPENCKKKLEEDVHEIAGIGGPTKFSKTERKSKDLQESELLRNNIRTSVQKQKLNSQSDMFSQVPLVNPSDALNLITGDLSPQNQYAIYDELYGRTASKAIQTMLNEFDGPESYEKSLFREEIKSVMMTKDYIYAMFANMHEMTKSQMLNAISTVGLLLKKKGLFPEFGGIIGDIFNMVVTLGPNFASILQEMWDWFAGKVEDVLSFIVKPFTAVWEYGNEAWDKIADAFSSIVEWIQDIWGGITGAVDDIKEGAEDAWDATKEFVSDVGSGIKDTVGSVIGHFNPF